MDPPPDQSALPSSPESRRAASPRSPGASPAPASRVAAEGAARALSPTIPERVLLCASSSRFASLRYLLLRFSSPAIPRQPHRRPSTRSLAASFGFFPAWSPEFQSDRRAAAAATPKRQHPALPLGRAADSLSSLSTSRETPPLLRQSHPTILP